MTRRAPSRLTGGTPRRAAGVAAAAVVFGAFGLTAGSRPAQALVIDPFFDGNVTVAQQSVIDGAISFYEQNFVNPITVDIEFETTGAGGSSQTSPYTSSYASYTAALLNNAQTYNNQVEQQGYNSLGTGNKAANIQYTSADGRALGCTTCGPDVQSVGLATSTKLDGIITVGANYYGNGAQTVYHEIDEVLGIGGWGSVLVNGITLPTSTIGPLDLYRYSALDTPSLTTSSTANAYFSLNGGATSIAAFNQSGTGDFGDWTTTTCYVQSYAVCNNPVPISVTSPEGLALQAVGYDIAIPEPAALALLGSGLFGLGFVTRRRRAG